MGFNTKVLFAFSLFSNKIFTTPQYSNYTLEGGKVCLASQHQGDLSLGKDNKSAIIVRDSYFFDDWSGKIPFDCRFTVKAHFNNGVFAVVQRMSLRKDPESNKCIDFIQFRRSLPFRQKVLLKAKSFISKPHDPWEKTYCGIVTPNDRPVPEDEGSPLASNAFVAEDGQSGMEVRIHVADVKLEPDEVIHVEIAFTSFMKDCRQSNFGAYRSCGEDTCIFKEYFDDKVVNCPFISCKDEPECAAYVMEKELLEKGLNTKVYITAVSSIFLSFFLFLGCIMLCRYFDLLCWNEPMTDAIPTELEQVSPTAPPSDSPDKDLPPAYETLFPNRVEQAES